jgi:polyphosphate kinase 2 (PPK2 family)
MTQGKKRSSSEKPEKSKSKSEDLSKVKSKKLASKPAKKLKNNDSGMTTKEYEKELQRLQIELVKLQGWIKEKGLKVIVIFEGRDAAGKGGVIKRIPGTRTRR